MPPALIAVAAFAAFARSGCTKGVRTGALALLWACGAGGAAHGQTLRLRPAGLPQVNLVVAWRVDTASSERGQQRVLNGQAIVDSRGVVVGRTGLGATTVHTDTEARGTPMAQVLQVLNGQQARLFVGRQVGRQSWQLLWSPPGSAGTGSNTATPGTATTDGAAAGAHGIQSQTAWVDLGDGLTVRPRWAGGRQLVLLDVEARSSRALDAGQVGSGSGGFEPDGQVGRTEVASTLALPLGQWTVLAHSGGVPAGGDQAGLSTRSLDEQGTQTLWVHVSLARPDVAAHPAAAP